jgi:hypothetical protein
MRVLVLLAIAGATAAAAAAPAARVRCSPDPQVAARYIVPPPPFAARVVSVRRWKLPAAEPRGRGPGYKRLYLVSFHVTRGNVVLPAGHTYDQFAYVTRKTLHTKWCFLKGGSGP